MRLSFVAILVLSAANTLADLTNYRHPTTVDQFMLRSSHDKRDLLQSIADINSKIATYVPAIVSVPATIAQSLQTSMMNATLPLFTNSLNFAGSLLNTTMNVLTPVVGGLGGMMGGLMGGLMPGGGGSKTHKAGGGGGGDGGGTPAPPKIKDMCTLTTSPSAQPMMQSLLKKWQLQWKDGMTPLGLNSARTQVCGMTWAPSDAAFLTPLLTSPTIL